MAPTFVCRASSRPLVEDVEQVIFAAIHNQTRGVAIMPLERCVMQLWACWLIVVLLARDLRGRQIGNSCGSGYGSAGSGRHPTLTIDRGHLQEGQHQHARRYRTPSRTTGRKSFRHLHSESLRRRQLQTMVWTHSDCCSQRPVTTSTGERQNDTRQIPVSVHCVIPPEVRRKSAQAASKPLAILQEDASAPGKASATSSEVSCLPLPVLHRGTGVNACSYDGPPPDICDLF